VWPPVQVGHRTRLHARAATAASMPPAPSLRAAGRGHGGGADRVPLVFTSPPVETAAPVENHRDRRSNDPLASRRGTVADSAAVSNLRFENRQGAVSNSSNRRKNNRFCLVPLNSAGQRVSFQHSATAPYKITESPRRTAARRKRCSMDAAPLEPWPDEARSRGGCEPTGEHGDGSPPARAAPGR